MGPSQVAAITADDTLIGFVSDIIAKNREYDTTCHTMDEDDPALDTALDLIWSTIEADEQQVAETPAVSFAGLRAKALAIQAQLPKNVTGAFVNRTTPVERMAASLADDISDLVRISDCAVTDTARQIEGFAAAIDSPALAAIDDAKSELIAHGLRGEMAALVKRATFQQAESLEGAEFQLALTAALIDEMWELAGADHEAEADRIRLEMNRQLLSVRRMLLKLAGLPNCSPASIFYARGVNDPLTEFVAATKLTPLELVRQSQ